MNEPEPARPEPNRRLIICLPLFAALLVLVSWGEDSYDFLLKTRYLILSLSIPLLLALTVFPVSHLWTVLGHAFTDHSTLSPDHKSSCPSVLAFHRLLVRGLFVAAVLGFLLAFIGVLTTTEEPAIYPTTLEKLWIHFFIGTFLLTFIVLPLASSCFPRKPDTPQDLPRIPFPTHPIQRIFFTLLLLALLPLFLQMIERDPWILANFGTFIFVFGGTALLTACAYGPREFYRGIKGPTKSYREEEILFRIRILKYSSRMALLLGLLGSGWGLLALTGC